MYILNQFVIVDLCDYVVLGFLSSVHSIEAVPVPGSETLTHTEAPTLSRCPCAPEAKVKCNTQSGRAQAEWHDCAPLSQYNVLSKPVEWQRQMQKSIS